MSQNKSGDPIAIGSLDAFLLRNSISISNWEKSQLSWETLQSIAEVHETRMDELRDSAEMFARVIQRIPSVHSVRWRIKDTDHLLEKIVRKCLDGKEKYLNIQADNYHTVVTDLVGIRALHLFKEDCFAIDEALRAIWDSEEEPIAYVRDGDPQHLTDRFVAQGFNVQRHSAGYRSIHYIFASKPSKRTNLAEVQVRTIFEEGWSEIDHKVRYPNFSDDQQVAYFLTIFNRLAGSADEMGTFVKGLTSSISDFRQKLEDAAARDDASVTEIERLVSELEAVKRQDKDTKVTIDSLRKEVAKLRESSSNTLSSPSSFGTAWPTAPRLFGTLAPDNSIAGYLELVQSQKEMAGLASGVGLAGKIGALTNPLGEAAKLMDPYREIRDSVIAPFGPKRD